MLLGLKRTQGFNIWLTDKRLYWLIVGSCWFNITQGTRAPTSGRNLINSFFRLPVETSYTLPSFFRQKPQPHTRPSFFRQKPHKLSLPSSDRNLIFSPFRFPVEISCTLSSDRNLINSPFWFPVETSYTLPSFFRQKPYILSILVTDRKLMNMSRISWRTHLICVVNPSLEELDLFLIFGAFFDLKGTDVITSSDPTF